VQCAWSDFGDVGDLMSHSIDGHCATVVLLSSAGGVERRPIEDHNGCGVALSGHVVLLHVRVCMHVYVFACVGCMHMYVYAHSCVCMCE
jgi:hypothetical protein